MHARAGKLTPVRAVKLSSVISKSQHVIAMPMARSNTLLAMLLALAGTCAQEADHVLLLFDSESTTLQAALDVMNGVGMDEASAKPILKEVTERGKVRHAITNDAQRLKPSQPLTDAAAARLARLSLLKP